VASARQGALFLVARVRGDGCGASEARHDKRPSAGVDRCVVLRKAPIYAAAKALPFGASLTNTYFTFTSSGVSGIKVVPAVFYRLIMQRS
jgi:hypothetical protein